MQWADTSTIKLLESIMLNTSMNSLFLVCAYRDNEIDDSHPFKQLLSDFANKNNSILPLKLSELGVDSVANLIKDTFHCTMQKAHPFAEIVCSLLSFCLAML